MTDITRRNMIRGTLLGATFLCSPGSMALAQVSLSDIGGMVVPTDDITIYTAREIITLDDDRPSAQAVAVVNGRILAVGELANLEAQASGQPYKVDRTFEDKVIVPGFIAQHDHPMLAAITMSSEILSIEDWVLPGGTVPAVKDKEDFMRRLTSAHEALDDPQASLLSWGYHPYFFGKLDRAQLDEISTERPIIVWERSCHDFVLNSAAVEASGLTEEEFSSWSDLARMQSDYEAGIFKEQGMFAVMPYIAPLTMNVERITAGLQLMRDYMHAKGVTYGNEPGGVLSKPSQDLVNSVMSAPSMPFRWSFTPDGKSLVAAHDDDDQVLEETQKLQSWYGGMTEMAQGIVKLFSDGAIYSLAMQLREPYLDGQEGKWMMAGEDFERAFRIYWDAGYQIHIHVNGDAGVDMVLNTLETNLRRNPRFDHRTTLVHFAVSAPDQVARIKKLGAIVSANPYYVTALSDKYGQVGLGPERADNMVRLGDLERAGVSYSLHSDMPMAPGDPLFLMWCAVNRTTSSGRVANSEQRATREKALRGITLEAAYSLQQEHQRGSIEPGKLANFTILDENPLTVDAMKIKDIGVWGTVMEGQKLKVGEIGQSDASLSAPELDETRIAEGVINHLKKILHGHHMHA